MKSGGASESESTRRNEASRSVIIWQDSRGDS